MNRFRPADLNSLQTASSEVEGKPCPDALFSPKPAPLFRYQFGEASFPAALLNPDLRDHLASPRPHQRFNPHRSVPA